MINKSNLNRLFATVVLLLIIAYGILKHWFLRIYAEILDNIALALNIEHNTFYSFIRNQAKDESFTYQTLGWVFYYPTYFLLHLLFIYLLFRKNPKIRNYLMLGLSLLIIFLLSGWLMALKLEWYSLSNIFRKEFKNLFGLPFILLAVEGGRILFNDVKNSSKINTKT